MKRSKGEKGFFNKVIRNMYRQLNVTKLTTQYGTIGLGQHVEECKREIGLFTDFNSDKEPESIVQTGANKGVVVAFLQQRQGQNGIYLELDNGSLVDARWVYDHSNVMIDGVIPWRKTIEMAGVTGKVCHLTKRWWKSRHGIDKPLGKS